MLGGPFCITYIALVHILPQCNYKGMFPHLHGGMSLANKGNTLPLCLHRIMNEDGEAKRPSGDSLTVHYKEVTHSQKFPRNPSIGSCTNSLHLLQGICIPLCKADHVLPGL